MFNYQKITSSKLLSFANFRQLLLAFCITGEYVFSSAEEIDYKIKLNDNLTTINNLLLYFNSLINVFRVVRIIVL